MDLLKAKAVGASFAMSAEVAGQLDVLLAQVEAAGCLRAAIELRAALGLVANAGQHLMIDMQELSGDLHTAATDIAVARLAA